MAKKNKGKNSNKSAKPQPKVVTQQHKVDGTRLIEETQPHLDAARQDGIDVDAISSEIDVDASIPEQGMDSFISEIKKFRKILEAVKKSYDKLKEELDDKERTISDRLNDLDSRLKDADKDIAQKNADADREIEERRAELEEEIAAIKADIDKRIEAYKDIIRSQFQADDKMIAEQLLSTFIQAKNNAALEAKELLEKIATNTTSEYYERTSQLDAREIDIASREKVLASSERKLRDRISAQDEMEAELRQDIEADIRAEVASELEGYREEIGRQNRLIQDAVQHREQAEGELAVIKSAFGDIEPSAMVEECGRLKKKIENLLAELNERPTIEELNNKARTIEGLEQELIALRKKLDDKEYYEYMARFTNSDLDVFERNQLQSQVESLKIQIDAYKENKKTLESTIRELTENRNKENAFITASKYDGGECQIGMTRPNDPKNLVELIDYLQSIMAYGTYGGKKLYYSKDTIRKFIAGLHMSRISILQGISGTGKTSLPKAIACALTLDDSRYADEKMEEDDLQKAPYRICPVQSGWRDKMDLIGFYNSFEKSYHETEFFNALYLANQPKYSDTLFFIVLDEMNLSRPEYYFADFLSKLELAEDQHKVKIDNVPKNISPLTITQGNGTLKIPQNVRFIGTANHDETTLEFAPKTYDRSNVIEMPRNYPTEPIKETSMRYCVRYKWLSDQFEAAIDSYKVELQYFEEFIKDRELLDLLAKEGIGIGNRLEDQAIRFISVFLACGTNHKEDLAKAADHLITTRLFRTLKDKYELGYGDLNSFKQGYIDLFIRYFDNEPNEAIELFDKELKKKKQ